MACRWSVSAHRSARGERYRDNAEDAETTGVADWVWDRYEQAGRALPRTYAWAP